MSQQVASLHGKISADTGDMKRGLDELQTGMKMTAANLEKIGEIATRTGKIMTVGLTLPIAAGFVKMIDSASDLSESMNKVDVVFGDSAATIRTFGQDAARSLGMSKQQALEAAGTFGNLFTSMGLATDQSAEMSTEIITLAADLASFNNIDPTVALEKLRAGLVGEVEPLRALGVNLSAAAVELKAVELGLIASGGEMTSAAKAQASFALIMEQTTNAQGDFARTSDGLANSTRILKAEISDAAAEMGNHLLPIALEVVKFAGGLVEKFTEMEPAGQKAILIFGGITAAIGPLLLVTGKLITVVPIIATELASLNFAALGPIALAVGLATGAFVLFFDQMKKMEASTQEAAKGIDGLTDAVDSNAVSWTQYRHLLVAVEKGQMTAGEAQEWLNQKIEEGRTIVDKGADGINKYGQELSNAEPKFYNVIDATDKWSRNIEELTSHDIRQYVADLSDEFDDLSTAVNGRLGPAIEDYADAMAGLDDEMGNVAARIAELEALPTLTSQEASELDGLRADYVTLQKTYGETASAHEEATRRIMFDLLTQRAALDGLTRDELALLNTIALQWGLVDQATVDYTMGADQALTDLANGAGLASVIAQVDALSSKVLGLEGTYDINFRISADYSGLPDTSSSSNIPLPPGSYDPAFASGTESYVVPPGYSNDNFPVYLSSGETIAVAKPGEPLPGGGGDTYYVTLNANGSADGIELYRQFKQALEEDLRASQRGGVQTSDY